MFKSKLLVLMILAVSATLALASCKEEHLHNFSDIEIIKEPTCTEVGESVSVCSCGEKADYTDYIPPIGHIAGNDGHCSVCKLILLEYSNNNDGTCEITDSNEAISGDIVIPEKSPDGNTVTRIMSNAFENRTGITSVTIPSGVTYVGSFAFYGCTGLKSVALPDSVSEIKEAAFAGCTSLESFDIPKGITEISNSMLEGCSSLKGITIPANITSIGEEAFKDCVAITDVVVPETVTTIDNAFVGCSSLESITLSQSTAESIQTFSRIFGQSDNVPKSLKKVTITGNGENIGCSFENCSDIESIIIPESVTYLDSYVFLGCASLKSFTIPAGVEHIGMCAFKGCESLTEITIPESVTSIDEVAFHLCTSLESITIPEGVTEIKSSLFSGCTSLKSVTLHENITSIEEYAFNRCSALEEIEIPSSVTEIEDSAFANCSALTSFTFHSDITFIGNNAFEGCTGLEAITIPASVSSIGGYAFENCTSLKSFVVEEKSKISLIKNSTFAGCSALTYIAIFESGVVIENGAFADCRAVESMVLPSLESRVCNLFEKSGASAEDVPKTLKSITVQGGDEIASGAFDGCSGIVEIILPDTLVTIGSLAFENCTGLESITIPQSVAKIYHSAFKGCTGLASIVIPGSVKVIGSEAFAGCTRLESITLPTDAKDENGNRFTLYAIFGNSSESIPESLKSVVALGESINYAAFQYCSGLTNIIVSDSVTSIANNAFSGCTSLESLTIPSLSGKLGVLFGGNNSSVPESLVTLTINGGEIGENAFSLCEQITNLTLGENVTGISKGALEGLYYLENLTIPFLNAHIGYLFGGPSVFDGVTYSSGSLEQVVITGGSSIPNTAFAECRELKRVVIPASVTSFGSEVFYRCYKLEAIEVDENNRVLKSIDGNLYSKDGKILVKYAPAKKETSFVVPMGVEDIHASAFEYATSLESVKIPESIKNINAGAFSECEALTTVYYQGNGSDWQYVNIDYEDNDKLKTADLIFNCTYEN